MVGGGTPSTKTPAYWDGDVPWITPKDLSSHEDRYISVGARSLTEEGLGNSSARVLPKDTVLVSSRAPVGYVAIAGGPVATNQGFRSLVLKDGHSPEFFYYLLKSNTALLESRASGSTFKELSGSSFKGIEFPIPPPVEQRRIAEALGALDRKIEANRRMNATLAELADRVFREQYSDRARGSSVPQGWKRSRIGDVVETVGGSTPSTKVPEYWDSGSVCWTSPRDLSGATSPHLLATNRHITEVGLATISSGLLPVNTVLLSSRAPVGYIAISKVSIAINQGYIAFPPNETMPPLFLYHWLRGQVEEIKSYAGGTTFPEISKRSFRLIPVAVPPPRAIAEFEKFAKSVFDKILSNDKQNDALIKLRDVLIPRLTSGAVRLHESA